MKKLSIILLSMMTFVPMLAQERVFHAIVAADGSGDYTSLNAAIATIPKQHVDRYIIYVKPGTYREHVHIDASLSNISVIGDDMDKVFIIDSLVSGGPKAVRVELAATVVAAANDVYFEGLSFVNAWGHNRQQGPQALALYTMGDKIALNRCGLWSYQDTYRTSNGDNARNYLTHCTIEGAVDFIYGSANAYFDACTLLVNRKKGGYIVAPKHAATTKWGYVFKNCTITALGNPSETTVWLGRPWSHNPKAVYINTKAEVNIPAEGWYDHMHGLPAVFAEYNTMNMKGHQMDLSRRINRYYLINDKKDTLWCTAKNTLTEEEAARYTVDNVMKGNDEWQPTMVCRQLPKVIVEHRKHSLKWHAMDGAIGYIVYKDGQYLASIKDTTFRIRHKGQYTVKAISQYGAIGK